MIIKCLMINMFILRKERREQQLRAYENQQNKYRIRKISLNASVIRLRRLCEVQSRIKQLEDRAGEVDEEDNSALRLKFPPASRSGSYPIICEDVQKKYGNHVVFTMSISPSIGDKGGLFNVKW